MSKTKDIVLTIVGGCLQWVQGIPAGYRVVVHDYDVEEEDWQSDRVKKDEVGDFYEELIWDGEREETK